MSEAKAPTGTRYRAFISYSHKDAAFASRLHRRLERYVLPKRLGPERRLTPIFKDREELPAAQDLSTQVRAALEASDCLIVVCSPDAAASRWVGREIETFRELHPDRPILAALVRGEPAESFPPALAAGGVEPLAADFRKESDGERLALLKLMAGVAGIGVDQLVQRDAQRRLRSGMTVTVTAIAGMLAMGGMTIVALKARVDAERQREAAEGLVEFMLTDLREGLKGAGSLRVLSTVNKRALRYYGEQNLESLPAYSLQRRARLLQAMGEDEFYRGNLPSARGMFDEAERATTRLVEFDPDNPDLVWAHAQSAFWRGFVAYKMGATTSAKVAWVQYRHLAKRLENLQPGAVRTERELAFAHSNLCTLAIEQVKEAASALANCSASVVVAERLSNAQPTDPTLRLDFANHLAWLADAQVLAKDLKAAKFTRLRQLTVLDALLKDDPENAAVLDNWAGAQHALGAIDLAERNYPQAKARFRRMQITYSALLLRDPENVRWQSQADRAARAIALSKAM